MKRILLLAAAAGIAATAMAAEEAWRAEAVNSRVLYGNDYNCTLIAYEDGSYKIDGAFGEGWDLEFTINADGTLHFTNLPADPDDPEVYVWYKDLWGEGCQDYFYQDAYSSIEGDMAYGKISYYSCYYTDYACWWGEAPEELWRAKAVNSQDVYNSTWECEIAAMADGSYTIYSPFGNSINICFTVNDDGTLHFTNFPADPDDPEVYVYIENVFGPSYHDYYYQDAYSSIEGDIKAGTVRWYSCWYEDYTCTWKDGEETGIESIDAADAPAEYYNLQGMRVNENELSTGIYIVRKGATVSKQLIRK